MLFPFSDVGEDDAPTRIRVGSHFDIPRLLAPFGEGHAAATVGRNGRGPAYCIGHGGSGTVYLRHPYLIHAAQTHHERMPRFLSQPPLARATPLRLQRDDGAYSPVETAIRAALDDDLKAS
jgi:hypothetical protein